MSFWKEKRQKRSFERGQNEATYNQVDPKSREQILDNDDPISDFVPEVEKSDNEVAVNEKTAATVVSNLNQNSDSYAPVTNTQSITTAVNKTDNGNKTIKNIKICETYNESVTKNVKVDSKYHTSLERPIELVQDIVKETSANSQLMLKLASDAVAMISQPIASVTLPNIAMLFKTFAKHGREFAFSLISIGLALAATIYFILMAIG